MLQRIYGTFFIANMAHVAEDVYGKICKRIYVAEEKWCVLQSVYGTYFRENMVHVAEDLGHML